MFLEPARREVVTASRNLSNTRYHPHEPGQVVIMLRISLYNDLTDWPWRYVGIMRVNGRFAEAEAGRGIGKMMMRTAGSSEAPPIGASLTRNMVPLLLAPGQVTCRASILASTLVILVFSF
jgi:hypothetical protein